MKGIILLNGDPYSNKIDNSNSISVCCDGAKIWADNAGITCDLYLGDFDSLGFIPENAKIFPAEKDMTDGEIALEELISRGVDELEIYGGSGRREDHFFGNVGLLVKAEERGLHARFISDYSEFYIVKGYTEINECVGTTVSLVPITESVHINNSVGLKYKMDNLVIKFGESRGLSNVITDEKAVMNIISGKGILFIVRKL